MIEKALPVHRVAKRLQLHPSSVRRMFHRGILKGYLTGPSKTRIRIYESSRFPIEGKFGQGKNGYRLNYIRSKLQKTSEAWIKCIFLVMNIMVLLKKLGKKLTCSLLTRLYRLFSRSAAIVLQQPLPIA